MYLKHTIRALVYLLAIVGSPMPDLAGQNANALKSDRMEKYSKDISKYDFLIGKYRKEDERALESFLRSLEIPSEIVSHEFLIQNHLTELTVHHNEGAFLLPAIVAAHGISFLRHYNISKVKQAISKIVDYPLIEDFVLISLEQGKVSSDSFPTPTSGSTPAGTPTSTPTPEPTPESSASASASATPKKHHAHHHKASASPVPCPSPEATSPPTLPTFFPPRATAKVELQIIPALKNLTLHQSSDEISKALNDAGYEQRSYFWLDPEHAPGFAIITHIEQIQPSGVPVSAGRWSFDLPTYESFSVQTFLHALLKADPGNYRLIALVVSKTPFVEKEESITQDQVAELNAGPSFLAKTPDSDTKITDDYHCIAYIYEFERKTRNDDPVFKKTSDISATAHLKSTGLLTYLTNLAQAH